MWRYWACTASPVTVTDLRSYKEMEWTAPLKHPSLSSGQGRYVRTQTGTHLLKYSYENCPESIRPFWVSRVPVKWPWYNLASIQRRPCCASVNSHSPMGLVSRQWDTVHWACVLCDRRIHNDQVSRSASSWQCAYPFYRSHAGFFGKESHHPGLSALSTAQIWLPVTYGFPKAKITVVRKEICECDCQTVQKLSQRCLTADWLAPLFTDVQ